MNRGHELRISSRNLCRSCDKNATAGDNIATPLKSAWQRKLVLVEVMIFALQLYGRSSGEAIVKDFLNLAAKGT